jgi:hypothetical protein
MADDEQPPTDDELAAAEALRRTLDGSEHGRDELAGDDRSSADRAEDARAAQLIAAASGAAPRLGDVAARAIVRRAADEAARRRDDARARRELARGRSRTRRRIALAAALSSLAAAALVLVWLAPRTPPRAWQSRSAGLLVPGPFPADQTAAQRLDVVTTDRMVALRESRLYGGVR